MKLVTLQHTDVRGNQLYYLKITNESGTEFMLNVGERTVKKINEMNSEDWDKAIKDTEDVLKGTGVENNNNKKK